MRTVQMAFAQSKEPFLERNRAQLKLAAINFSVTELVPEPEQFGMLSQRIAAESLHFAVLDEFQNPQHVPLQVRPAELRPAFMIFQIALKRSLHRMPANTDPNNANQHCAAARGRHRADDVLRRNKHPQKILPAKRQLPLQIGDLFFGVGDLLIFLERVARLARSTVASTACLAGRDVRFRGAIHLDPAMNAVRVQKLDAGRALA